MNLRTKLAITGLGVAVLMLLAVLTPAPAMAQIASCTTDASGNTDSKLSLRAISAALASQGHLNERGSPLAAKSVASMLAS